MTDILLYLSKNRAFSILAVSKVARVCGAMHARGLTYLAATCGVLRATLAAPDGLPFASSLLALWRAMAIARPLAPFSLKTALKCSLVAYWVAYLVASSGRISARALMTGCLMAFQCPEAMRDTWRAVSSSIPANGAPLAQ